MKIFFQKKKQLFSSTKELNNFAVAYTCIYNIHIKCIIYIENM